MRRALLLTCSLLLSHLLVINVFADTPPSIEIKEGAAIQADNYFPTVKLETSMGDVIVELDRKKAPTSVNNFLRYASKMSYDGTIFHRVINGFVVQGGGYDKDLKALPSFPPIINESGNGLKNKPYTIAMARKAGPHTGTRQFYFNLGNNRNLDPARNWGYTVFGKVIEGMEIVDEISKVKTAFNPHVGWRDVPVEPVTLKKVTIMPEQQ